MIGTGCHDQDVGVGDVVGRRSQPFLSGRDRTPDPRRVGSERVVALGKDMQARVLGHSCATILDDCLEAQAVERGPGVGVDAASFDHRLDGLVAREEGERCVGRGRTGRLVPA